MPGKTSPHRPSPMPASVIVSLALAACGGGGGGGDAVAPAAPVRSWKPAQEVPLETFTANADDPAIAMDAAGNAVAVWIEREPLSTRLTARRCSAAGVWEPGRITEARQEAAALPQVAIDNTGRAVLAWVQDLDNRQTVAIHRQPSAGIWGTTLLVDTAAGSTVSDASVAVGPAGSTIVAWSQTDGLASRPFVSHLAAGGGTWGAPLPLGTSTAAVLGAPRIGMRPDGTALAVWSQLNPTDARAWYSQYQGSTGWSPVQQVAFGGPATRPRIAVDVQGNAVAVWLQFDGTRISVRASRAPAGGTWGTAQWIESNDAGDAVAPTVAVDGQGNAWAVWTQSDGTRSRVWGARMAASGAWSPAQLVEATDAGTASHALLAVDTAGNALVVWQHHDGRLHNIWASRYTPAGGWSGTHAIENYDADHAREPALAMDAAGRAQVIWRQQVGGRHSLWSARFD